MPTPTLHLGSEVFLEYRGYRVFHVYRADEFPDRLQHVFSFSPEEDDLGWQFDVRGWRGRETLPTIPPG
jgi:hypothetical protein